MVKNKKMPEWAFFYEADDGNPPGESARAGLRPHAVHKFKGKRSMACFHRRDRFYPPFTPQKNAHSGILYGADDGNPPGESARAGLRPRAVHKFKGKRSMACFHRRDRFYPPFTP